MDSVCNGKESSSVSVGLFYYIIYGVIYEDSYTLPRTLLGLEKEKESSLTPFCCDIPRTHWFWVPQGSSFGKC
ncbi:unnamed protein product [Prunus brigantina]